MDIAKQIQQQLIDASSNKQPLQIIGNGSKSFYGRSAAGDPLQVKEHTGIIDYQPDELTITARAGTPLSEINDLITDHGQMLPFEPPTFSGSATLGGCIASGLAGPRRPWTGATRDYVIGIRLLTGDGRDIRLGGKVMKNVAGYDLFRPMTGALGTLGVMLEITLKLLPLPEHEISFRIDAGEQEMVRLLHDWTYASLPLSAASHSCGKFNIRLSGTRSSIDDSITKLPADREDLSPDYWQQLNEQQLDFFTGNEALYRFVVPANAPATNTPGDSMLDWGGALRWQKSTLPFDEVQHIATKLGGSVALYRNGNRDKEVFPALPENLFTLHQRIKQVLDPAGILNPGRLYRDL
jgi:glycolate oxidase FAD binding subunit